MVNVTTHATARRPDEEPDVDEVPQPWLDDPNSPAYTGLCETCGHRHDTDCCPNVTADVWTLPRLTREGRRAAAARWGRQSTGGAL